MDANRRRSALLYARPIVGGRAGESCAGATMARWTRRAARSRAATAIDHATSAVRERRRGRRRRSVRRRAAAIGAQYKRCRRFKRSRSHFFINLASIGSVGARNRRNDVAHSALAAASSRLKGVFSIHYAIFLSMNKIKLQAQNVADEETREMAEKVQSSPWAWRQFAADFRLFAKARTATSDATSFARDLRHLDSTASRKQITVWQAPLRSSLRSSS